MILHFIILNRQQRTAFALSSTPSLFSFSLPNSQMDLCFSDWLLAALSVSTPCSVPRGWLWCREDCCVVGWVSPVEYEPGTVVTLLHYLFSSYYEPGQGDPRIRLLYKLWVWLSLVPHSYYTVDSMFLCLSSRQDCFCPSLSAGSALRLSVTALVSKWMFWNVR